MKLPEATSGADAPGVSKPPDAVYAIRRKATLA